MRGIPTDVAALHLRAREHAEQLRREAEVVRLLAQRPRAARWHWLSRWPWRPGRPVLTEPAAERS